MLPGGELGGYYDQSLGGGGVTTGTVICREQMTSAQGWLERVLEVAISHPGSLTQS